MNRTFLTNNGNILLLKNNKGYFYKNEGSFLRFCTDAEIDYLIQFLPEIEYKKPINWEQPVKWTLLWRTSYKDLSTFKAETSCNGGDYAFETIDYAFVRKTNKSVEYIIFSTYNTSAEFDYDELVGSFQTNLKDCYAIDTEKTFWVKSQHGDFSISQNGTMCTVDDVLKMKNSWTVKSDDDEIESYSEKLPFSELKRRFSILENLGYKREIKKKKNGKKR